MATLIQLILFWRNKISSVEYTISSGQPRPSIGLRAKPALGSSCSSCLKLLPLRNFYPCLPSNPNHRDFSEEVATKKPSPGVSRVTVSYEQVGEFKNQDCRMMRTVFVIDLSPHCIDR